MQGYGLVSLWIKRWVDKVLERLKDLPHWGQLKLLSWLCTERCCARLTACPKDFLQSVQEYGRSPSPWLLLVWTSRPWTVVKFFEQELQEKLISEDTSEELDRLFSDTTELESSLDDVISGEILRRLKLFPVSRVSSASINVFWFCQRKWASKEWRIWKEEVWCQQKNVESIHISSELIYIFILVKMCYIKSMKHSLPFSDGWHTSVWYM